MQKKLEKRSVLLIGNEGTQKDVSRAVNSVIDVFQYASGKSDYISLIGIGTGAAFAVMLAERFMPDEIRIAPFIRTKSPEEFFFKMKSVSRRLYAVCANATMYIPECIDLKSEKRALRMLRDMRSDEKIVIRYKDERKAEEELVKSSSAGLMIKTLAAVM